MENPNKTHGSLLMATIWMVVLSLLLYGLYRVIFARLTAR